MGRQRLRACNWERVPKEWVEKDLEMLEKFQERQEKYDEHNAAWH